MSVTDPLDLNARALRKDDLPWRQLDETVLLLDLDSGDFFELDEVGTRIWVGLDGTRTLDELAHMLVDEFAVDLERARADIIDFVADLCARQLASRVD